MSMLSNNPSNRPQRFNDLYDKQLKHLRLQGLRHKTIDAYSRAIRRMGEAFDYKIEALTEDQLLDHFSSLLQTHSISTVKLDLYGLKFFYLHVLKRDWNDIPLVKSPRVTRLPDVLTLDEVRLLLARTRVLSYRIFFYTAYSMGLRLSEALALEVGDIDAHHLRVHIRNSKGGKDRLVPLTQDTLAVLRHFWQVHRHPRLLFPNRKRALRGIAQVNTPLDRGGLQKVMREVVAECGFKKRFHCTVYATVMRPIC
ncbi:MAG: site-specific integrase [Thiomicrorhabdus sp.]|nr:site-specific integrase [Thiomicrorhabdus sp.]